MKHSTTTTDHRPQTANAAGRAGRAADDRPQTAKPAESLTAVYFSTASGLPSAIVPAAGGQPPVVRLARAPVDREVVLKLIEGVKLL